MESRVIIRNPGSNFSSSSDSTFWVKMVHFFFQWWSELSVCLVSHSLPSCDKIGLISISVINWILVADYLVKSGLLDTYNVLKESLIWLYRLLRLKDSEYGLQIKDKYNFVIKKKEKHYHYHVFKLLQKNNDHDALKSIENLNESIILNTA